MEIKIDKIYDTLGYLTTREMWELMKMLGIKYVDIGETEKQNLKTGELIKVPKLTPRTDYDNMKSEITVAYSNRCNREQKRKISKWIWDRAKGRIIEGENNGV